MSHSRTAVAQRVRTIDILGVPFARLSPEEAVTEVEYLYDREEPTWIAIENAHALNLACADTGHRDVLRRADLVLNDGKGVMLGARLLGVSFPADLNGNFTSPLLLATAEERGWPVFFLGAAPGVIERAAERLRQKYPKLSVAGLHHGFIPPGEEQDVVAQIRASGAGLLMVGMGMPLQEQWIDRHLPDTGVRLASTAGAFFDFQAGTIARAPHWMNRVGLEWVHRLAMEPRRMWRRYLVGNPLFIARVLRQRWGRGDST